MLYPDPQATLHNSVPPSVRASARCRSVARFCIPRSSFLPQLHPCCLAVASLTLSGTASCIACLSFDCASPLAHILRLRALQRVPIRSAELQDISVDPAAIDDPHAPRALVLFALPAPIAAAFSSSLRKRQELPLFCPCPCPLLICAPRSPSCTAPRPAAHQGGDLRCGASAPP